MKVNKIRFSAIHAQWEILKMRAAYVAAEKYIISEADKGNDITGFDRPMSPEEFNHAEVDEFGNITKMISEEEFLIRKGNDVQDKIDEALEEEDYRKAAMLKNVLRGLELKYNKLRNRNK